MMRPTVNFCPWRELPVKHVLPWRRTKNTSVGTETQCTQPLYGRVLAAHGAALDSTTFLRTRTTQLSGMEMVDATPDRGSAPAPAPVPVPVPAHETVSALEPALALSKVDDELELEDEGGLVRGACDAMVDRAAQPARAHKTWKSFMRPNDCEHSDELLDIGSPNIIAVARRALCVALRSRAHGGRRRHLSPTSSD